MVNRAQQRCRSRRLSTKRAHPNTISTSWRTEVANDDAVADDDNANGGDDAGGDSGDPVANLDDGKTAFGIVNTVGAGVNRS